MSAGPSFHKATFFTNQEVFLQPFYYDPEHDFSFFRYDPAELKGIQPRAIRLAPEKAYSGLEVRVVGFASDEKMTVHQAELSQLDRNAPFCTDKDDSYTDFNTFYYQASGISGSGSSGAPVVDIAGDAVALKCSASSGASLNFYLPLQRVKYAFEYVRKGQIPPRGTLQAVFEHQSHVKAERLGLTAELAASEGIDVENSTGVLTVKKIVPKGPADGVLKVGDIVVSVNGTVVLGFPELFEIIDAAVDQQVSLCVFRSHEFTTVTTTVQDIYQVTPMRALRLGSNIFHDMSFVEAAITGSVAITGVKVLGIFGTMFPGYESRNTKVITEVNYNPTPNLDAFMDIITKMHSDEPIVVKAIDSTNPRNENVFVAHFLQTSCPDVLFTRSPATGFWSTEPFSGPLPPISKLEIGPPTIKDSQMQKAQLATRQSLFERIEKCKVWIYANPICSTNGYFNTMDTGLGLIVDPQRGLILCSSRIGKNPASNFVFTIGISRINATLAYIHPLYPFSVLKYNPDDLADSVPALDGIMVNVPECAHNEGTALTVGLDISLIIPTLDHLRVSDFIPKPMRVLDVQFTPEDMYNAYALGVSKMHVDNLQAISTKYPFYKVERELNVHTNGAHSLNVGDIIVQVNGQYVKGIVELASFDTDEVELCVVRNGKELTLTVPTAPLYEANIRKLVCLAGMVLQEPFHSVNHYAISLASKAYNFIYESAAPSIAETYHDNMFVVEIGGHAISTLDDVVQVAKLLKDPKQAEFNADVAANKEFKSGTIPGRDVKIRAVFINGDEIVKSIRTNDHYCPAWQLTRGPRIDDNWSFNAI
ncbi:hypothetical protein EV183_003931 [Coemansia sp. RSA 2336]|nr:hypothetical protein EV183_003931 [Coemansia sp. RSA 2336]